MNQLSPVKSSVSITGHFAALWSCEFQPPHTNFSPPTLLGTVSKSFFSPKSLIARLQGILKCAARLVVGAPPDLHITPVRRHFHWLSVKTRISYKTACPCFNAITAITPTCLSDLLQLFSSSPPLRSLLCQHPPPQSSCLEVQGERWTCCPGIRSFLLELPPSSHSKCYNNRYFKARFENQSLNLLEYDQLFPGLVW